MDRSTNGPTNGLTDGHVMPYVRKKILKVRRKLRPILGSRGSSAPSVERLTVGSARLVPIGRNTARFGAV